MSRNPELGGPNSKSNIVRLTQNIPDEWTMPAEWKISEKGKEAIRVAVSMSNSKHGLYASVPIVCKGKSCPYVETCSLDAYGLTPDGERCPIEIAEVMKLFDEYNTEFEIDEKSRVDLGLLKELIDIEVTILRADHILAKDGNFIQDVVVGVSERGESYTRPEIHKAQELKDKLGRRKHEILKLFNSTRQDKAKNDAMKMDPSTYASELLKRAQEAANTVDAEYEVVEEETKE